ncbi:Conserved_hypothetical protein [Hexamita inflata]|uniref:Uncharacterized protein n=1 Tax=Hexamita inflata TaxID=28002 RepID=A0AA86U4B4_9EUKA|nr:Conserved hypothetical protein [Hexamita inflata]
MDKLLEFVKTFESFDSPTNVNTVFYKVMLQVLQNFDDTCSVILDKLSDRLVTRIQQDFEVLEPKYFVSSLILTETRDNQILLPYIKCKICDSRLPSIGILDNNFSVYCHSCNDQVVYIKDLLQFVQTPITQHFLMFYHEFVEQVLKEQQQQFIAANQPEIPMQFFAELVKQNKHYEYLQNPMSVFPFESKTFTINNQQFKCVHYTEGGINKFENVTNPSRCPIYTYYCTTDKLYENLEKDYEASYEKTTDFDPSLVIIEQKPYVPKIKQEVDPEELKVGHAVIIKDLNKYEYINAQFGFVVDQYFEDFIQVTFGADLCVVDSNDLLYVAHNLTYEKVELLHSRGIYTQHVDKFYWNLSLPQHFDAVDYFTQLKLATDVDYQAVSCVKSDEGLILCLTNDRMEVSFVPLDQICTPQVILQQSQFVNLVNAPLQVLAPQLCPNELIESKLNYVFQTLQQTKQLSDILQKQADLGFSKLSEVLSELQLFIQRDSNQEHFLACKNWFLFVFYSIKRVKGSFPEFEDLKLGEINGNENLAEEIEKVRKVIGK